MRSLFSLFILTGSALLAACSDGSAGSGNNAGAGGSSAGAGGSSAGAAGSSAGSGGSGGDTTTTTDSTTTSDTMTTTTTTMAPDPCDSAGVDPVSFANDVQPILGQSCGSSTTCHLKAIPSEGMSLKAGEAYAALVDVPAKQNCNGQVRVKPGSALDSYIVNKITDTDICGNNKRMPPGGLIPAANRQKIIDWICQGAMNN